ncbi:MAG: hypothetical protein Q8O37_06450 [Sulfuricellaceae bacterium]|nr:hypothetical protein [Sulfuricellaceae bacterium]
MTSYCSGPVKHQPFALSLSKGLQGFDKLSPNGTQDFIGPEQ